jgi:hypothetical protein
MQKINTMQTTGDRILEGDKLTIALDLEVVLVLTAFWMKRPKSFGNTSCP